MFHIKPNSCLIVAMLLMIVTIQACYYDNEAILYGQSSCDTSAVKYSVQIKNILNASCLSCHSGTAAAGAGIKLDDYASVKKAADNGSFLSSVTRTVNPMPKGAARLGTCRISEIQRWIQAGAPNN